MRNEQRKSLLWLSLFHVLRNCLVSESWCLLALLKRRSKWIHRESLESRPSRIKSKVRCKVWARKTLAFWGANLSKSSTFFCQTKLSTKRSRSRLTKSIRHKWSVTQVTAITTRWKLKTSTKSQSQSQAHSWNCKGFHSMTSSQSKILRTKVIAQSKKIRSLIHPYK